MAKYQVVIGSEFVSFTNDKGVVEKFDNIKAVESKEAITLLKREGEARNNATAGALSLIVEMLDSPRLDAYKGKTPANEKLSKEVKSARRELEVEFLKPKFLETIKGNVPDSVKLAQWDKFIDVHRSGGVWSLMNSIALQYYCIVGQLPCVYVDGKPQKDKLLPKSAMEKIIANMRTASDTTDKGISGKLTELYTMLENRNDKTNVGEINQALHVLEQMTRIYKALQNDIALQLSKPLSENTDTASLAKSAVRKAAAKAKAKDKPFTEADKQALQALL